MGKRHCRTLTAVLLIAHVPTVIIIVTLPNAVYAVPIEASVLVWQTRVFWHKRENKNKLA